MGIINMRPDKLEIMCQEEGHEDENGDYIQGARHLCPPIACSGRSNEKAEVIEFENGNTVKYSYEIDLPRDTPTITYGDVVRFTPFGRPAQDFKVLGFKRYQLYCKLWL